MNYTKLIIFLAAFTSSAANASSVTCPATVKAGTPLSITAIITNDNCTTSMTINRTVKSLIGNSGAGSIGLQGPFVTPFANNFNTLIPRAICKIVPYTVGHPEWGTYTKVTPSSHTFTNLVINVPVGMGGTLVAATAGVLDTRSKIIIAGTCNISVTK